MFSVVGDGLVFFGGVLPRFSVYVWRLAPEIVLKNSLFMSGLLFWVRSLFLGFLVDVVFFVLMCFGISSGDLFVVSCLCFLAFVFFLFLPPPSLGAGPGPLSSSFCCLQACDVDRQERCCIACIFSVSVFSLPGPAPLSLSFSPSCACTFFFSLSLFFSLFFSLIFFIFLLSFYFFDFSLFFLFLFLRSMGWFPSIHSDAAY